jgi:RND family efflux transporter MFP subunit
LVANNGIVLMMKKSGAVILLAVVALSQAQAVDASATELFEGLVTPEGQVALAAPSEGLVTKVLVREGDRVESGAAIAELASEEEKIRLRLAELQSRKLAEDASSVQRLYEEKAASRDDYTRAMLAAEQAAAERDLMSIRLKDRTVVSPQGGHVLRLHKDAGESVRKLETFADIVSLDRVKITAYVPARHLGRIARGSAVKVHVGDGDPTALDGVVDLADPVLDPGGEVFRMQVLVEQPGERLRAGTRVQVEVSGEP